MTYNGESSTATLGHPNGVDTMDELWKLVQHEEDLEVVLRTDEAVYDDEDVSAFWTRGNFLHDRTDRVRRQRLAFEISDDVCRKIQSSEAQSVMSRFFGYSGVVDLAEPFLGSDTDKTRGYHFPFEVDHSEDKIAGDRPALKTAIQKTAKDTGGSIPFLSTAGTSYGRARVEDGQLQLYIPDTALFPIKALWRSALNRQLHC